jgi:hypothetical protein
MRSAIKNRAQTNTCTSWPRCRLEHDAPELEGSEITVAVRSDEEIDPPHRRQLRCRFAEGTFSLVSSRAEKRLQPGFGERA